MRGLAAARIADPLDRLRDAYGYEVGLGPELARPNWVRWAELVRLGFHDAAWRERAAGRLRDWCEYDAALTPGPATPCRGSDVRTRVGAGFPCDVAYGWRLRQLTPPGGEPTLSKFAG